VNRAEHVPAPTARGVASRAPSRRADLVAVTEDFLEFFGSRAVAGRLFEQADTSRADAVVVADANLARLLWPGEPAVGQRIRMYDVESEVIGVAEPVRYGALTQEMQPKLYHLLGRSGGGMFGLTFLVRHDGRERTLLDVLEARVQEVDGSLRLTPVQSLSELYDRYLREPRFYMLLLGALGLLALVVATVGIYGVVSYLVTRRTGEIGIRMALGARWPQIVALLGRQTLLLVATGIGAGLAGAVWLTRYVENLLFRIEPTDPIAFAAVAALLATTALAATLLPMRRALRVDPATTLRSEQEPEAWSTDRDVEPSTRSANRRGLYLP
jgi:hypothetical protein